MKWFRSAMKLTVVVCLSLFMAIALVACGDDGDSADGGAKSYERGETVGEAGKVKVESDQEFDAEQQAVIARIGEFADATEKKDYKKICNEILTKESRKIGGDCVGTLEKTGEQIESFEITVSAVTVSEDGKSASATATTTTNGEPGGEQTLNLVKDGKGEWRVTILGQ